MTLDTNAQSPFVDGDEAVGDALRQQVRALIPVIVLGEFVTASRSRGTALPMKSGCKRN